MRDAIGIIEDVLTEHGLKHYENPPKPGIHPLPNAFIHAMPGYLPRKKAGGVKWVSGFPGNPNHGLPTITGVIVLNDVQTGLPIAIMDGAYITALRTAAVSGVSAKYLANRDASILGIVGAGIQGRYNLLSLKEVLPELEVVRVYDTNQAVLHKFTVLMADQVPYKINTCDSIQQVTEGADVVVTATGHLEEKIFKESWVQAGALILPVHSRGWEDAALRKADKFVVDDWGQFSHSLGGPDGYYGELPDLHAELGEIVVGRKPGREDPRERIINFNYGMAIHDVYMAAYILEKATAKGVGQRLPLIEEDIPFS